MPDAAAARVVACRRRAKKLPADFSITWASGGHSASLACLFQPDILESDGLIMSPQCSNGGATILVVDDEPLVLDMISQELTAQGFAVLEAETGEAALSIIESGQTVDVLFTDIRLPGGLDGWRLAAMAREAKPGLPVIYVTGYNVNRDATVPGSVFLKKPYRPSAITEIIRTLIGPNPMAAGAEISHLPRMC